LARSGQADTATNTSIAAPITSGGTVNPSNACCF
jgi:hypothetical protein